MANRDSDRYVHFLFDNTNAVYLKEKEILKIVEKYPYFSIDANNVTSFYDSLKDYINESHEKYFIIINTDNISTENQKVLASFIKDKSYQALELPETSKIIVTGNKNKIDNELLGLLIVVDD